MIATQLPESLSWVERFYRYEGNPILRPQGDGFAADLIFNPGATVHDGKVGLLCRGVNMARQPKDESNWGISSLGWAWSSDGLHFQLDSQPVPELSVDGASPYQGGFEDPRLVRIGDEYLLTYTGTYNCMNTVGLAAFSRDLMHWDLAGEILPGRAIAVTDRKINGKYWAYWYNWDIRLAVSEDLRHWEVLPESALKPRPGYFDEQTCEAAAAPLVTDDGILLIYNGACCPPAAFDYSRRKLPGYWGAPDFIFATGWALFDRENPAKLIARCEKPFLTPEKLYEFFGMSNFTIFSQGLVRLPGKYILYYGCDDARIACAISEIDE